MAPTIDNVHTQLHPAFRLAVREGLLGVNPTFHGVQWIDTEVIQIPCGHLDNIDDRWTSPKSDED